MNLAFFRIIILSLSLTATFSVSAQDEAPSPKATYVGLEPDIVTNYAGDNSRKLGYIKVIIEMVIADPAMIPDIEYHMPLLRASAIEIFGTQPEEKIKSLTGREDIRRTILQSFKNLMKRETGEEIITNIIFTKYLRQGG